MFGAELVIVLLAIYLGARLGGIGIGFAGGLGVLVLTLIFQIKPGAIPFDVIEIIMAVIAAIAAMQVAGGMDYLVSLAERMLRRHPKYITFLAPLVTWFMTILAGTGHTAFSTLPVITEVAKEQGIRPSRPLSIAVVASQIAITASPISAAVVFFAGILEPLGVSYLTLLSICIPVTLIAVLLTSVVCNFLGCELKDDPVYQERLAKGEVRLRGSYVIRADEAIKDADGNIVELRCSYDPETLGKNPEGRKVKGVVHWVPAAASVECEVRLYDRLFRSPNPEKAEDGAGFLENINPDSLQVLTGCRAEPSLGNAQPEDRFQFEREGYFCADIKDSKPGQPVFNRTVTLRDSWGQ